MDITAENGPSMTVRQLYEYIVSQMTPEEALMRLLGGTLEVYDKLKDNKPIDPDTDKVQPLFIIASCAMDMGWEFIVENDKEHIEGLIIGTQNYMERNYKTKP